MATQTKTQRKSAGEKAAATRKRNAAKRRRSAQKAAETRARAELNTFQSAALKGQEAGQRALDVSVGAVLEARDRVTGAVRPIVDSGERKRFQRSAERTIRGVKRRGEKVRS